LKRGELEKAGRNAGLFVGAPAELLPAAAIPHPPSLENMARFNKPLMACTGHWKSRPVLPMF
jgi:hypothetical protein